MSPSWTKLGFCLVLTIKHNNMGRSVSVLRDSTVNVYSDVTHIEDHYEFQDMVEYMRELFVESFPSMDLDSKQEGETSIIVSNKLVEIGVSEYCGALSVSIRAREERKGLGEKFAYRIQKRVIDIVKNSTGNAMSRVGTFSNGESVYRQVN